MKIYVFCNTPPNRDEWYVMLAIAEDGNVLASHICSDPSFGPHDMGITSDWKHEFYQKHCPDGYELEWVDGDVLKHPGVAAAYAKNQAQPKDQPVVQEGGVS